MYETEITSFKTEFLQQDGYQKPIKEHVFNQEPSNKMKAPYAIKLEQILVSNDKKIIASDLQNYEELTLPRYK